MSPCKGLPGSWVELHLTLADEGGGLGPALGWLGGVLASGGALWPWPHLGRLLLGLFLTTAVWGGLWALCGEHVAPVPAAPANTPRLHLPYTEPGSLSAEWGAALGRAWARLRAVVRRRRHWLVGTLGLGMILLVVTGLWSRDAFVIGVVGLPLLGLRRLVRARPIAVSLLRLLGGLAWPWWLGHVAWAPLTGASLFLSLLWGLAYVGWAELSRPTTIRWPLLWTDLAQSGVLVFFLLSGRPVVGGALTFTLLGQVLLQVGLSRASRHEAIPRRIWPFAAAGLILTGLASGGWI